MKRIIRTGKKVIVLASLFAVVLTFGACSKKAAPAASSGGAAQEVIRLKFGLADPQTLNYYDGAVAAAEAVKEATNGRVLIDVYAGGQLGNERDMVEGALIGTIDIATAANAVMASFVPEMAVLDQPFLFDTSDEAHHVIDGKVGDLIAQKLEARGLHLVGWLESGFRNVFSTRPVTKPEDFRALKIRTMENDIHMAIFNQLGAISTPMPTGEQFSALQQGTIDAGEAAISSIYANKFYEVAKNITYTKHLYVFIGIMMSDKAWNQIPADLRPVVAKAIREGAKKQRQILLDANADAEKILRDSGVAFHDIDTAALQATAAQAMPRFASRMPKEWLDAIDADKK